MRQTFRAERPCHICGGEGELLGDPPWITEKCWECEGDRTVPIDLEIGDIENAEDLLEVLPEDRPKAIRALLLDTIFGGREEVEELRRGLVTMDVTADRNQAIAMIDRILGGTNETTAAE